jgi:hypothetical protein
MPILNLPPVKWEFQKEHTEEFNAGTLGDGYELTGKIPFSERDNYTLTFPKLTDYEFYELLDLISAYAGYENFQWREFDWQEYKTYVFESPSFNPQGKDCWELSVNLKEIK